MENEQHILDASQNNGHQPDEDVYPVLHISDMYDRPAPDWLIQKILPSRASAYLYGDDGTCKTGLAEEIGMRMAYAVTDWFGTQLKAGVVAIVAGEGEDNIGRMIQAFVKKYEYEYGLTRENKDLIVIPEGVAIDDPKSVWKLGVTLRKQLQGRQLLLIIFDTLSTCLESADDTKNSDMIKVNRHMRSLQKTFGCSTWIIHHSGKDPKRGMRGASDLRRSADVVMFMEHLQDMDENDVYKCTVEKLKGRALPKEPMSFRQEIISLDSQDNFQDEETGYVLIPTTNIPSIPAQQMQNDAETALDLLFARGELNNSQWMDLCREKGIRRSRYTSVRDQLLAKGAITHRKGERNADIYSLSDFTANKLEEQHTDEYMEGIENVLGLHGN